MGLIYTTIELTNPRAPELSVLETRALVDTGSMHLCIPDHVAIQLQLEEVQRREVTIADGSRKVCPYVGPVKVVFGNRTCFTGAFVLGSEVLLGAIPMEDMDLVINPQRRTVEPNPDSPNIPSSIAMIMARASHASSTTEREV